MPPPPPPGGRGVPSPAGDGARAHTSAEAHTAALPPPPARRPGDPGCAALGPCLHPEELHRAGPGRAVWPLAELDRGALRALNGDGPSRTGRRRVGVGLCRALQPVQAGLMLAEPSRTEPSRTEPS